MPPPAPLVLPRPWDPAPVEPADEADQVDPWAQPAAVPHAEPWVLPTPEPATADQVDPRAQPAADPWSDPAAATVPTSGASTGEPTWVAPSPMPADEEPPAPPALAGPQVEFVGYIDAEPTALSGLPPVVAVPDPARPIQPPAGSIADVGLRPPDARSVDPVVPAAAPTVAAAAVTVPAAATETAFAPQPGPADRVAPPDPATAAGVTPAATGADLWDLVTGPPAAPVTVTPPAPKTSRLVTIRAHAAGRARDRGARAGLPVVVHRSARELSGLGDLLPNPGIAPRMDRRTP